MAGSQKKRERLNRWREWSARPQAIEEFCDYVSAGIGGLRSFSIQQDFAYRTLREWVQTDADRAAQYARARDESAHVFAADVVAISRDRTRDPQCRRVEMDALKWYASKLLPKDYGDKIQQEVSGTLTLEEALLRLPSGVQSSVETANDDDGS